MAFNIFALAAQRPAQPAFTQTLTRATRWKPYRIRDTPGGNPTVDRGRPPNPSRPLFLSGKLFNSALLLRLNTIQHTPALSGILQFSSVLSDGVSGNLEYGTTALLASMPQTNNHKPMFNLKQRREQKALQAKTTAKLGHLSKQLTAANAVLDDKDKIIKALKNDISRIKQATEQTNANLVSVQAALVKTRAKIAASDERTTAKAIELAASAGHQPKHINQ